MGDKLKVFIVDDEYLIRNLIKMKVDWEEAGMEVVGESGSAEEALQLVDKLAPDIIFTDICMPSMNGIEFSKVIMEKHPEIKIIVVTGYDDFEYARDSVRIGVSDYILKPINTEEIMDILEKLKAEILSKRKHEEEFGMLRKQIDKSMPILRERFLNELLLENLSVDDIESKTKFFNLNISNECGKFQTAVIEIDDKADDGIDDNRIILSIQCLNIVNESFKDNNDVIVFFDNGRRIVILSGSGQVDVVQMCENIKKKINDELECFVNIGIGMKVDGAENIRFSYKEAIEAVNYKVIAGKNEVISYRDIHVGEKIQHHMDEDRLSKLNMYINAGAKENALEILNDIFLINSSDSYEAMEQMRLGALDVLLSCQYVASQHKINLSELRKKYEKTNSLILKIDNLPELKKAMKECVEDITQLMKKTNEVKVNSIIENVKEYLNDNISNQELTLKNVAKEFYISSGHLGRLFKQNTSMTFVEYLTSIRIEKIKKLLLETDFKGSKICEECGISDPHYLSILFKKQTGISINEFKKTK